jgi:hypothetical protein
MSTINPIQTSNNMVSFGSAIERVAEASKAGDVYQAELESINEELTDSTGTTLGTMGRMQLSMTELEAKYQVSEGLPKKAIKVPEKFAKPGKFEKYI